MSDADPVVDEAWGEPVLEAPFEEPAADRAPPPPASMDVGVNVTFELAHETGAAVESVSVEVGAIEAGEQPTLQLPIHCGELLEALGELDDQVPYGFGSKPSSLGLTTAQFLADRKAPKGVDCSGFVRWLLFRASTGKVKIPDGTWNQRDHFQQLADVAHMASSPYAACGRNDGVLRVAGFVKSATVAVGHIWIVHNGLTGESHGGKGINRRPWNTSSLVRLATWCYPLARLVP